MCAQDFFAFKCNVRYLYLQNSKFDAYYNESQSNLQIETVLLSVNKPMIVNFPIVLFDQIKWNAETEKANIYRETKQTICFFCHPAKGGKSIQ